MSEDLVWNDGAPPSEGWWRCTDNMFGEGEHWRWWNGECWSYFAEPKHTADYVRLIAGTPVTDPHLLIRWCDYWPVDARVAREV